ncbi:MAG: zinc-binding dehydrogenase [Draconibacterium sp.]
MGADQVIDYTREDLSIENTTYDVIFDTIGKAPITQCVSLLKEGGMSLLCCNPNFVFSNLLIVSYL